jgi:Rrf2 family protein
MDVLRRNTDYGLRMMAALADNFGGDLMSARQLAERGKFSYDLGCKILQKLHRANLVESGMGSRGGFALKRKPSEISLMEIIIALQGGIRLNSCLPDGDGCEFQKDCEISTKLSCLQLYIEGYLDGIKLSQVAEAQTSRAGVREGLS